jgi:hypothetical protein
MSRILRGHSLWKSVDNVSRGLGGPGAGNGPLPAPRRARAEADLSVLPLGACSACSGDYEDPDRTAGSDEESDEDEDAGTSRDEFPAREA